MVSSYRVQENGWRLCKDFFTTQLQWLSSRTKLVISVIRSCRSDGTSSVEHIVCCPQGKTQPCLASYTTAAAYRPPAVLAQPGPLSAHGAACDWTGEESRCAVLRRLLLASRKQGYVRMHKAVFDQQNGPSSDAHAGSHLFGLMRRPSGQDFELRTLSRRRLATHSGKRSSDTI